MSPALCSPELPQALTACDGSDVDLELVLHHLDDRRLARIEVDECLVDRHHLVAIDLLNCFTVAIEGGLAEQSLGVDRCIDSAGKEVVILFLRVLESPKIGENLRSDPETGFFTNLPASGFGFSFVWIP